MDRLNSLLFPVINAPSDPSPPMLALAQFAAGWLLYLVVAGLAYGWLRGDTERRGALFWTVATAAIAVVVNFAIATSWYHPRPHEMGMGHQFMFHAAETSFPSDHGTVLFALAFGAMRTGLPGVWSGLIFVSAVTVAWARIYLGVHWPMDMAGSFLVALTASLLTVAIARTAFGVRCTGFVLALSDRVADLLRLPVWLTPRSRRD